MLPAKTARARSVGTKLTDEEYGRLESLLAECAGTASAGDHADDLGGGCGEVDLLVQIGEGEMCPDGLQVERVFHVGGGSEQPAAVGLAGIQLGADALRGHQQVLADRLNGAVVLELAAAVVGLGEGESTSTIKLGLSSVSRDSSRNRGSPQKATASG